MGTGNNQNRKKKMESEKKKRKNVFRILLLEIIIFCIILVGYILFTLYKPSNVGNEDTNQNQNAGIEEESRPSQEEEDDKLKELVEGILVEAKQYALGYDYDMAISKLQEFEESEGSHRDITEAINQYQTKKDELVPLGAYDSVEEIHHIFFHSLIADTSKAFDGDYEANGYNYYMTTISEFVEMMNQMYEGGYVLVSMHDIIKEEVSEDGTKKLVPGDIMLPPDKKPFVLSQDDVNYYKYMGDDGFASRVVIDEDGRPSTEMVLDDGSVVIGDYDIVPILETFISEHPDFSYKGARGILAITGYEGTLGYRTNDVNSPSYEEDKEKVKEVAEVLKEWGWEFASHSYGHRDMNKYSYNFVVQDTKRWLEEVGSLIGPTDIFIFPYGIDIEDTSPYDGEKYQYLKEVGFSYFCGVYKSPWMQRTDEYVRMTRRPLDGQAMLQFPERLTDLFDLSKVIDPARPPLQ